MVQKRKRKKVAKLRGSKTHGWGHKKKHRGKGSRGGRGYAGSFKHRKLYIKKYEPDHMGSRGFTPLRRKYPKMEIKAVDLDFIEKLKDKNEVDLSVLGYNKVLGSGNLSRPVIVRADFFSKKAREKIESAGGKAVSGNESP